MESVRREIHNILAGSLSSFIMAIAGIHMKARLLMLVVLMASLIKGFPQGYILNAGDTFEYQFDRFRDYSEWCCSVFGASGVWMTGYYSSSTPGSMEIRMYENSFAELPFHTATVLTQSGGNQGMAVEVFYSDSWRDHQGAIRFTMVSGSLNLESFSVGRTDDLGSGTPVRTASLTVVPVPEPGTVALLTCGAAMLVAMKLATRKAI